MSPLILLAEDDPITREVVGTHLRNLGLRVDTTASVSEGRVLGARQHYAALLFDRHLQGGDAIGLLADFRADRRHANARTPAIAMSAELRDEDVDLLLAAGFADVIEKPTSQARLKSALAQCGLVCASAAANTPAGEPAEAACAADVLDDALGVQSCGSIDVLLGLRSLLGAELPAYLAAIGAAMARQDAIAVAEVLHRMKSALAFCGAAEMLQLLARLQAAPLDRDRLLALRDGARRLSDRLGPPR